jgi:hypothetical protein
VEKDFGVGSELPTNYFRDEIAEDVRSGGHPAGAVSRSCLWGGGWLMAINLNGRINDDERSPRFAEIVYDAMIRRA